MTDIINVDDIKKTLQEFAEKRDWDKFHNPKNLSMALACEAGELLEIFQWMSEPDATQCCNDLSIKEKTSHELADIMLYLFRIASLMGINITEALYNKISINNEKYPVELVKGSSKKYNEY